MRHKTLAAGIAVLALAVLSAGAPLSAKGKGAEEGTWKVTVTPDTASAAKGEKEFEDTLVLHKGKFRSTACAAYGFREASYRTEGNNWMSDVFSDKQGKNHWHGLVDGDSVSGQLTWTKADGSVMNYTFTGKRTGSGPPAKTTKKPGK